MQLNEIQRNNGHFYYIDKNYVNFESYIKIT